MPGSDQTIVIYSLDYDGCSNILFEETLLKYDTLDSNEYLRVKDKLNDFFETNKEISENVEVYVGSKRQSCRLDQINAQAHKTGSCFVNLQMLCEQKEWVFRPLLLADIYNQMPPGSAINNDQLDCTDYDRKKTDLLKYQLMDAEKNHPDKKVHFFFLDDDCENKILPELKNYLNKKSKKLSSNIHVHLVKFYWLDEVRKKNKTLIETFYIQGKNEKIHKESQGSSIIRVYQDSGNLSLSSSKFSFFSRGRNWIISAKNKISRKLHQEDSQIHFSHKS